MYEIEQAILDCLDTETGEVIDFEQLTQLDMDRQHKIDNITCWYKQLSAESDAIDVEIKALSDRMKSKKNKADSLKLYLSDILGGMKFESARNKISWRASDEVAILNESLIPDKYKIEQFDVKISKADIKKDIKDGITVTGAELVYKNNIQIK
jgi:hypothetical protein